MRQPWQAMETAPKDGTEIVVDGGELWDDIGSPTFGGLYVVYWTTSITDFSEGAWTIKAGAHTLKHSGYAIVHDPQRWCIP